MDEIDAIRYDLYRKKRREKQLTEIDWFLWAMVWGADLERFEREYQKEAKNGQ